MKKKKILYGIIALVSVGVITGFILDKDDEKKSVKVPTTEIAKAEEKKEEFLDDAKVIEKQLRQNLKGEREFPLREDGKKIVYLTFDDGPSTTVTPKILDVLEEEKVKATFFVLGSNIDSNDESKEVLRRIVDNGHALANHTYSHDYKKLYPKGKIDKDYFLKEIKKTEESIKKVVGEKNNTRVIRFPGGYWSWQGRTEIKEVLDRDGYASIDWNALNRDAEGKTFSKDKLIENTKNTIHELGEKADMVVLLMHDTYGKETTAEGLKEVIDFLREQGFEFRTMK